MAELEGVRREVPRTKTWAEVTDEELVEAVRRLSAKDEDGIARGASSVLFELSSPTAEQWEANSGEPAPANAALGMGLIPPYSEAGVRQVAPRLRKLVKAGKLEAVEMVRPMGKPAPPGYRVPEGGES